MTPLTLLCGLAVAAVHGVTIRAMLRMPPPDACPECGEPLVKLGRKRLYCPNEFCETWRPL